MSLSITTTYNGDGVQVHANLHDVKSARSGRGTSGAWVTFKSRDGQTVSLFVDERLADMLAEAFVQYENDLSSQEGPTFDDALGAKCDARAREDAARALK